jgi:hypothetical protein
MTIVGQLDADWDTDGFLGQLRTGAFEQGNAARFLKLLRSIDIPEDAMVPKRVLSLLWYLPSFLVWHRGRVTEQGGDIAAFDLFVADVHNALEDVLGVP